MTDNMSAERDILAENEAATGAETDNKTKNGNSEGNATDTEPAGNEIEQLESELGKLKDDYLRLQAEFDNYRRRTTREKLDIAATGGQNVIVQLLPVLDDIDRALLAMQQTDDIESVRQGIELVAKKLRDTLAAQGLSEIEAIGQELDTDLHEAVARIPAPGQKGKIVEMAQKGYKLGERVIRHAKCVVGE